MSSLISSSSALPRDRWQGNMRVETNSPGRQSVQLRRLSLFQSCALILLFTILLILGVTLKVDKGDYLGLITSAALFLGGLSLVLRQAVRHRLTLCEGMLRLERLPLVGGSTLRLDAPLAQVALERQERSVELVSAQGERYLLTDKLTDAQFAYLEAQLTAARQAPAHHALAAPQAGALVPSAGARGALVPSAPQAGALVRHMRAFYPKLWRLKVTETDHFDSQLARAAWTRQSPLSGARIPLGDMHVSGVPLFIGRKVSYWSYEGAPHVIGTSSGEEARVYLSTVLEDGTLIQTGPRLKRHAPHDFVAERFRFIPCEGDEREVMMRHLNAVEQARQASGSQPRILMRTEDFLTMQVHSLRHECASGQMRLLAMMVLVIGMLIQLVYIMAVA